MEKSIKSNEVVEFNILTIMEGKFGATKGTKQGKFKSFSSLRLLTESGFVPSEKQSEILSNTSYKWFYHILNNEETTGTIIVTLHKKDINVWSYANIDTNGNITVHNTIQDAKANI